MTGNHWSDWLPLVDPGTIVTHPCTPIGDVDDGFTDADKPSDDELLRLIAERLDLSDGRSG